MDNLPISHEENALSLLGGMPSVAAVRELEGVLRELGIPEVDIPTSTLVHDGMAARTIFIPAGTLMTGALGRANTVNVFIGDITVTTDEGTKRLTGYNVMPGTAGAKRAGVSHADTWWTTIHRTALTDLAAIEDEYTEESDALLSRRRAAAIKADQDDHAALMQEMGIPSDFMAAMLAYSDDLIPMPAEFDKLRLRPSSIHGQGMFAMAAFAAGQEIAPMPLDGHRTPAGRFINHSMSANAEAFAQGTDIWCRSTRPIFNGEEITVNYRQVLSVNTELKELFE